ncbi:hypothetical protein LguiB_028466 [Lonicera macranthoides]
MSETEFINELEGERNREEERTQRERAEQREISPFTKKQQLISSMRVRSKPISKNQILLNFGKALSSVKFWFREYPLSGGDRGGQYLPQPVAIPKALLEKLFATTVITCHLADVNIHVDNIAEAKGRTRESRKLERVRSMDKVMTTIYASSSNPTTPMSGVLLLVDGANHDIVRASPNQTYLILEVQVVTHFAVVAPLKSSTNLEGEVSQVSSSNSEGKVMLVRSVSFEGEVTQMSLAQQMKDHELPIRRGRSSHLRKGEVQDDILNWTKELWQAERQL